MEESINLEINKNSEDESYLNILSVAHKVVGGIGILLACFQLIHVSVGLSLLSGSIQMNGDEAASIGWVFSLGGLLFFSLWGGDGDI